MVKNNGGSFNLKQHAAALLEAVVLCIPLFFILVAVLAAGIKLGVPMEYMLPIVIIVWGILFYVVNLYRKQRGNNDQRSQA